MSGQKWYSHHYDRAKEFEEKEKWGMAADAWKRAAKLAPSGKIWQWDNNRSLFCRRKANQLLVAA